VGERAVIAAVGTSLSVGHRKIDDRLADVLLAWPPRDVEEVKALIEVGVRLFVEICVFAPVNEPELALTCWFSLMLPSYREPMVQTSTPKR